MSAPLDVETLLVAAVRIGATVAVWHGMDANRQPVIAVKMSLGDTVSQRVGETLSGTMRDAWSVLHIMDPAVPPLTDLVPAGRLTELKTENERLRTVLRKIVAKGQEAEDADMEEAYSISMVRLARAALEAQQ